MMKRIMFTLCVTMLSVGIGHTQSNLVLNAKGGSAENIELTQKPVVTFGKYGDEVTVTCDEQTKTIDLKDLQVSGVDAESNELVILRFDNKQAVVIKLSTLLSIVQEDETDQLLPKLIASDQSVSIYNQALELTGLADSLCHYVDVTYTVGADSTEWNNNMLVKPSMVKSENVAYMARRYYKFTALLVKDEVLANKYGITNIDGLRRKAHEIYDAVYPEDASVSDETDRRNALNRFISYHVLPFLGEYYKLTCIDGEPNTLSKNFRRKQADISDWYETMMPNSIMKFSFPAVAEGLYINRRGIADHADNQGQFVAGSLVPYYSETERHALNGLYTYIDDIVAYDQTMQQVVCNDRMRIDCTTLSPDFMTSGARGHWTRSNVEGGKYAEWSDNRSPDNKSTCLGFKGGSAKNFSYNDTTTHLHVSPRYLHFWNYQGDVITILGPYDVTVKLPAVPAGKYELRMGVATAAPWAGLINIYIDDELKCEQLDIRYSLPQGTVTRENGWMPGPASYSPDANSNTFADIINLPRKIIGTFTTDGQSDHFLRLQQMSRDVGYVQLIFDYIELIPVDAIETEDKY